MRGGEVVSRKAHNLQVAGSNPAFATNKNVVAVLTGIEEPYRRTGIMKDQTRLVPVFYTSFDIYPYLD